jgi:hypothetical protein
VAFAAWMEAVGTRDISSAFHPSTIPLTVASVIGQRRSSIASFFSTCSPIGLGLESRRQIA